MENPETDTQFCGYLIFDKGDKPIQLLKENLFKTYIRITKYLYWGRGTEDNYELNFTLDPKINLGRS